MLAACIVVTVLTCLVGLMWILRHVLINRERTRGFTLEGDYPGPPDDPPLISVLVAAKDEEACISQCVSTMLDQDYPNFEMIVCNDRSEDRTAAIVERIAAEDSRVRLVNIEHLPDGWCGKNNAMQVGIASARGRWICMIDADCRQTSGRTLSVAMQYARQTGADLLSVLPRLEMRGFWENVIQPVCSGVMMIWFNPAKVNNPQKPNAYANGAFMLMRREAYDAIGTHEAVRDQVNEDMHMAARVKQLGLKLRVVRTEGLYVVRMYTSLRQILRGWARIFFGTFGTFKRLTVSFLVMAAMGLLPYTAAAVGFSSAGGSNGVLWLVCGWAGLAATAAQLTVIFRYYRLLGVSGLLAWTYPLGCAVTLMVLISSMTKLLPGAAVVWKDTTYARTNKR